ncbi:hypothetical protein WAG28_23760 [Bacillus cereus]
MNDRMLIVPIHPFTKERLYTVWLKNQESLIGKNKVEPYHKWGMIYYN